MESDPVWNRLCEAAAQEGSYACSCTDPFTMSWRTCSTKATLLSLQREREREREREKLREADLAQLREAERSCSCEKLAQPQEAVAQHQSIVFS